jgi:hypothetical protein
MAFGSHTKGKNHMSSLVFSRAQKRIKLLRSNGAEVGTWHAENNAQSGAQPWPNGQYAFSWHSPHAGDDADSSYGSHGNFIFEVPGREGMGVHSGRKNVADGRGNRGPAHVTDGCVRTTDECTGKIKEIHAGDPLKTITIA